MSNVTPELPLPDGDPAAPTTEVDGEKALDPDVNDDLVDSAAADAVAADGDRDAQQK
ncbi:hypothetical protein NQ152_12900 [Microbacterium sp. zg.B48]|uniref:hypothetical protein n=1 Tax=Microbacterium sp. zg.B48 TaxID=2969408 RepID=UPI00214BC022|nr:hypothetical protein [Microbacterium sp. zg.B48]MCR2764403.1 hypothetical protein [Microbacterium sp. zg.B48]